MSKAGDRKGITTTRTMVGRQGKILRAITVANDRLQNYSTDDPTNTDFISDRRLSSLTNSNQRVVQHLYRYENHTE
eukprot:Awhi_evm1s5711